VAANTIDPNGRSWEEVRETLLTPEERSVSGLRVAMMVELIKARAEQGISQKNWRNSAELANQ